MKFLKIHELLGKQKKWLSLIFIYSNFSLNVNELHSLIFFMLSYFLKLNLRYVLLIKYLENILKPYVILNF
jgi:hypothetical protein